MTPAIRLLERAGVAHGVHEYERGDDLRDFGREAAEQLGLDPDQVFKTLLIEVEGGAAPVGAADPVVAVVPVSCTVAMKSVAAAVGAKRASMCDPARAERVTGYVVGGISPFGQKRLLATVLDETAELFDVIFVSGGRRGLDVSVSPDVLVDLLSATVADIT